jgi:hypothetical protein
MQRWTTFTLRAAFIVGFLIVLPVMAMPTVASYLDRLLYGNSECSLPPAGQSDSAPEPRVKTPVDASQAAHEVPIVDEPEPGGIAARIHSAPPPPLQRVPDFLPRAEQPGQNEPSAEPADVGPLDQATAKKIDAVRSRLEKLGADYVRLEMSEDGRTFHCLCDMLLENSGGKTQPFEATRNDPVAAAEAVLANVEAWRNAETTPARTSKGGPAVRPR